MVNATTTATDASSGAAAMKKATGMNKDDFLKLFIAQMQNQDPLNPMDGTQFVSQLAQLTQVEQAYNTNSNLENLINAQGNSTSVAAVSFLGNTVTAKGSQVNLTDGGQPTLSFTLASSAQKVSAEIRDANGALVRTLTGGKCQEGLNSITWDGKSNTGQALPAGAYTFAVKATNATGQDVTATTLVQGKVDGVSLEGTVPVLSLGGIDVPLDDIISVKGA